MSAIYSSNVLRIAVGEIGYVEKATNKDLDKKAANPGTGNWTKYARDLWAADPHFYQGPKNGYDWCAVFVDWCVYMASGMDSSKAQEALCYTGPYGAGCGPSVVYYKAAGRWHDRVSDNAIYVPAVGDQIFFGTPSNARHTGLVERVDGGTVYTIEGNSSNMVRRNSYALNNADILGYGKPMYDGVKAPAPAEPMPFVDIDKNSWYYNAAQWAYNHGILVGTDHTHASPDKPATRAEIWQMFCAYEKNRRKED